MNEITGLQHPLMQALGLAILHSLWQGVLLYCLCKLVLTFVPERRSELRYRLSYAALSILFLLFLYTFRMEAGLALALTRDMAHTPVTVLLIQGGTGNGSFWQLLFSPLQLALFSRVIPWLSILYAAGVIALCFKMTRELLQLRYFRKQVSLPDSLLLEKFEQLKKQAGIGRSVLLRLSEKVQVPVMLGHLKPIILLPLSLVSLLDMQQIEAILLHELAHIRRNDYLWNILQTMMETLLFFNPVAWILSSRIREEREHCCDAYVLRHSHTPLPYAHALLALEEYRLNGYAMAATGNKKSLLLNRIKRITAMKPNQRNAQRTLATFTILVLLAAMICFVSAFGQSKKEDKSLKPVSKTFSKSYSRSTVTVIDDKGNVKTYNKEAGDTAGMAEALKHVPGAMDIAAQALDEVDMKDMHKTVAAALANARAGLEASRAEWEAVRPGLQTALDQVDWDKINADVHAAMSKVDWSKVNADVKKAVKEINWDEIQKNYDRSNAAMSKVDWSKVSANVKKAVKEIDWDEIQKNYDQSMAAARKSMKNIDFDQVRRDIAAAKEEAEMAMQEARGQMQLSGADMEEVQRALKDAREDIKRAKREMKKAMEQKEDAENSQAD